MTVVSHDVIYMVDHTIPGFFCLHVYSNNSGVRHWRVCSHTVVVVDGSNAVYVVTRKLPLNCTAGEFTLTSNKLDNNSTLLEYLLTLKMLEGRN